MSRSRRLLTWLVPLGAVAAFAVGVSAEQATGRSQGVVTPEDPVFGLQDPSPEPAEPAERGAQAGARGGGRGGGRGQQGPRPYDEVVRRDARTDEGIFKVHRVNDNLLYEIPKAQLARDFLWVTQIKRTTYGAGYGGQAVSNRVVRWELNNNRVLLRLVNHTLVADPSRPIARAVQDANTPAIVRAFNVAAFSKAGDPVIDVTQLYLTDVPEFSARGRLGARGMDANRSYLEKVVSFPENVNVQVMQTFTGGGAEAGGGRGGGRAGMRGTSGTVAVFHSMVKLPESPMMPRLADDRVGYFTSSAWDYGRDEHKAVERTFIRRYRLEKKDPSAPISEPVKPIVYYVDPATPAKFVPFVKQGIEDWQPAFEHAGFRGAIVARDAPSPTADPDWDPEDARYSVIRWLPSTTENASGPSISDPRSGEILEADIQFYHNVQNLATMWYFAQVSPLDPRAQKLPLPDDLMGELIRYVVAHEVGHTLGLRHNMKASSLYAIEQVRDPVWVRENGHTPTLMDYSRFNYVAQPEDKIPAADLIPKIGPYDKWAIMWGYKPVPTAATPDAERATVDLWAREQDTKPYLRFSTAGESEGAPYPMDPGQVREAVGDSDPVRATELGLRNLARVADLLVPATTTRPYDSYELLTETYGRVVSQWRTELGHVVNVVGGVDSRERYIGQTGPRFTPIPRTRQAAAVQFLLANGFRTPSFLVRPDVLRRIEAAGAVNRIRVAQSSLMAALLQADRLERLIEQSAVDRTTYTPLQFLTDLRLGLWSDLAKPVAPIDVFRRNVQRVHIDAIDTRLNGPTEPSDEVRALLKGELRAVDQQIAKALPSVTDVATRRHLQDARDLIAAALDPRAMRTRAAAAGAAGGRGQGAALSPARGPYVLDSSSYSEETDPFLQPVDGCWVDVTVR
jgi:hypothetical protein